MNYLSKIILQQLLPQYVEVPSDSLNVEQAGIKLAKGKVKTKKINPILQSLGMKIDQCSYSNILIVVPWMQIYKKPIKITIQQLKGQLCLFEVDTISSDSSIIQQPEITPQNSSVSAQYLRSILKRLLFNMQINIKLIVFNVKNKEDLNLTLNIQNITIKNSKLSQQSKDIIKTVAIQKVSICYNRKPFFQFKGFNLCLDAGDEHMKSICLINSIFLIINFQQLNRIKQSIVQFTRIPVSRKGSIDLSVTQVNQSIPDKKSDKSKQIPNSIAKLLDLYFKIFEIEMVIILPDTKIITTSKNIQFSHNTKIKTKTKFSLTQLLLLQQKKVIFSIKNSKQQCNLPYFINYNNIQQKTLHDPQVQIQYISQEHICIKLYYIELAGNQHLFLILQQHLKKIIDQVKKLLTFQTDDSYNTSKSQLSPVKPQISMMTTVQIYQCMIHIQCQLQRYKLFLSIQYVINDGCLYQFDSLQISIRNKNIQILKVFDSEVSITQDDVYVRVQMVQIQGWIKSINFFRKLTQNITKIVSLFNQPTNYGTEHQIQQNKQQVNSKAQVQYKYLILVRNLKVCFGNVLLKQDSNKFIDLFQLAIKDVKLVISNDTFCCSTIVTFIFTDQQTLLQQPISNPIHFSFQKRPSKGTSIQILNNISLKLQSRYLKYIFNTLIQSPNFIQVTNFTNKKIKINCEGCASLQLLSKVNSVWFPLLKTFKLQSPQMKLSTNYMDLDFQMDNEKQVEFIGSKDLKMIICLKRTKQSNNHLIIKPLFKALNCLKDLYIIEQKSKTYILLKKYTYHQIDFEDQYSLLHKSEDLSQVQKLIDSDVNIYFEDYDRNRYLMKQLVTKDNITLYALESLINKNYFSYIIRKNGMLTIMPFLSLKNNTNRTLKIIIEQKKSSKNLQVQLKSNQEFIPQSADQFDFYMRQLTIKVSFDLFQSEAYYFNTFAFLSEPHQQTIPLRSNEKGNLQKKHLIIKETSKLRSKFLEFTTTTYLVNECSFDININFVQRNVSMGNTFLKNSSSSQICLGMKSDLIIFLYYENQIQTKVSVQLKKLKQSVYVISFNFCKIKQKFKNVLILCQLQRQGQSQKIIFRPFITIMNLTSIPIKLGQKQLTPNQTSNLFMAVNSDNEFNNRSIKLDLTVGNQIFNSLLKNMEHKKGENQLISVKDESIDIGYFIKKTVFEVKNLPDKRIFRLVKDINKKISLYIIEGVHSDSSEDYRYSFIKNNTQNYFLLSEEPVFQGLFQQGTEKHLHKLDKYLIHPYSISTIMPKSNYSILFCNEKGQRLNQLNNHSMELKHIQQQKHSFQKVEARIFEQKIEQFRGEQLTTNSIQIQLSLEGEPFVIFQIKRLKIRRLQKTKFDFLLSQLLLKDTKKGVNVVGLRQNTYAILDFTQINYSTILIKNMFIKFTLIQIDLRKQFLLNLIKFSKSFNKSQSKLSESKTQTRQQSLIEVVKSKLLLIKNIFVEEFNININIQLEALVFSNQLAVPLYKTSSTTIRQKKLFAQMWKFYSSSLVSKFPKLSFLIQNLKHPLNILKNIYNLRQTLKSKVVQKLTYWPHANKYSPTLLINELPPQQFIMCIIPSVDRIIILSNKSLMLQQYTPIPCRSIRFSLNSIRKVSYYSTFIQVIFSENNSIQIEILKKDQQLFNSIIQYLLE